MQRILIIGNGFDLSLGLKTSYSDFLKSNEFTQLMHNENMLAAYLKYKEKIQNWVDVEHELKNYANGLSGKLADFNHYLSSGDYTLSDANALRAHNSDRDAYGDIEWQNMLIESRKKAFKNNFVALKRALQEYLLSEFENLPKNEIGQTKAFRLLKFGTLFDNSGSYHDFNFTNNLEQKNFDVIYTFNYTNPLQKIDYTVDRGVEPYFIHGSLNQKNIVFGVEDGSIPEEFNFLLKSDHAAFGSVPDLLLSISGEAKEFHFFGCSLGDTDNAHFADLFAKLAQTENVSGGELSKHKLFFYVYDQSGYQHIRNRILHLTKSQFARFKLNHDVTFYDIKSEKIVDQNYLNQL